MGKGLTGWLSPNGDFYPCNYGEHHELSSDIYQKNREELGNERARISAERDRLVDVHTVLREIMWIPMGASGQGSTTLMDYVFVSYKGMTDEQIAWFKENFDNLSPAQQEMVETYLEVLELDNFL
ncbi:hypothetical protein V7094_29135 [Priestia megaterium]|uniref:hypothetical protein n=1 Tax=Priestia megaterium TaxID=1404 RepID=UPI002FFDE280